jgi:hypothetical protein
MELKKQSDGSIAGKMKGTKKSGEMIEFMPDRPSVFHGEAPSVKLDIKQSERVNAIRDYVVIDSFSGGGFPLLETFENYLTELNKRSSADQDVLLERFLNSEYGLRLRKALAKCGVREVIVDLISPELWDDYNYAFAVRNTIVHNGLLYISIPSSEAEYEVLEWILSLMRDIWQTRWGHDALVSEGFIYVGDNTVPTLSSPQVPEYFAMFEILRFLNVLPNPVCDTLEEHAYGYLNELRAMTEHLNTEELIATLWTQLQEETGDPIMTTLRDKATNKMWDISTKMERPDFRLKRSDIGQYAALLSEDNGLRLTYSLYLGRNLTELFLQINVSSLFKTQISPLLANREPGILQHNIDFIQRKTVGLDGLLTRMIRDAAEYELLELTEHGATFVGEEGIIQPVSEPGALSLPITVGAEELEKAILALQYPGGPIKMIADILSEPGPQVYILSDPHPYVTGTAYADFLEVLIRYLYYKSGLRKVRVEAHPLVVEHELLPLVRNQRSPDEYSELLRDYEHILPMLKTADSLGIQILGFDPRFVVTPSLAGVLMGNSNLPKAGGQTEQEFLKNIMVDVDLRDKGEKVLVIAEDGHVAKTEELNRMGLLLSHELGDILTTAEVTVGWETEAFKPVRHLSDLLTQTNLVLAAVNDTSRHPLANIQVTLCPEIKEFGDPDVVLTPSVEPTKKPIPIRVSDFDQLVYFRDETAIVEYLESYRKALPILPPKQPHPYGESQEFGGIEKAMPWDERRRLQELRREALDGV